MMKSNRLVKILSALLVAAGLVLLALNVFLASKINIALPLVFLMLGAAFFLLVPIFQKKWPWSALLYIPGAILCAFGIIFLFNIITNDWNAWAYAWLLLVAGAGLGTALAGWQLQWREEIGLIGIGLVVAGLTLFALFGAIARGPFIQVVAPLLLVAGGIILFWLKPRNLLPESLLRRFGGAPKPPLSAPLPGPDQAALVEPVSARELEVLRLIDQGLTNTDIAARLTVAPSTVKTHINNIYGKLGVQTRTQALKRARELGLLNGQ